MKSTLEKPSGPSYRRPKHAAEYLQIGVSTLWRWAASLEGFPAPIKAGPRVTLFDTNAIDAYLHSSDRSKNFEARSPDGRTTA